MSAAWADTIDALDELWSDLTPTEPYAVAGPDGQHRIVWPAT